MSKIPTVKRRQVKERDGGRCTRCQMAGAQWHHRRSRRVVDEHTHCACNGLWMCPTCHRWAHDNPITAKRTGQIIPPWVDDMWNIPFTRLGATWMLPSCDGLLQPLSADQVLLGVDVPPRPFQGRREAHSDETLDPFRGTL